MEKQVKKRKKNRKRNRKRKEVKAGKNQEIMTRRKMQTNEKEVKNQDNSKKKKKF